MTPAINNPTMTNHSQQNSDINTPKTYNEKNTNEIASPAVQNDVASSTINAHSAQSGVNANSNANINTTSQTTFSQNPINNNFVYE